jgi:hypothetical protein
MAAMYLPLIFENGGYLKGDSFIDLGRKSPALFNSRTLTVSATNPDVTIRPRRVYKDSTYFSVVDQDIIEEMYNDGYQSAKKWVTRMCGKSALQPEILKRRDSQSFIC